MKHSFARAAILLVLLRPTPTLSGESETAGQLPWFKRCLAGMEVGPTGAHFGHNDSSDKRYAARFNGTDIVRRCVEAHSEYIVIWARDGDYAYYNSKIARKCPGLGKRDVLRETLNAARPHKLPVITYCVVQQGGHFLRAHPEFEMRGADDKPIGRFCYNSGYLDAMRQLASEQLAYGIDGFHIDMLDQGFGPPYGCWCKHCRTRFESEFGHPMPKGVTWDAHWDHMLEFRYQTSARFERALRDHIKTVNPRATVDFNYHGNPPFSWEVGQRPVQHAGNGDFVTGETGVWGFSALTVGLNAEFYRAATPGLPYQVAIQRGVRMYHDQTTRPLNDIRWELFTLLAHGAFVTMVDKTAYDGWLDPVAYERIGAAFAEVQTKRNHFGQGPVYDIGLWFSARTRDWVARGTPGTYFMSFQGAHKASVLEHLSCGVALNENATQRSLRQFPVVCLPNAGILSAREVDTLRQYVETGGKLLITGQSGGYGPMGSPLADTTLSELIGATVKRRLKSLDNWVKLGSADEYAVLARSIRTDWPFLVKGPATVYQPTTAKTFGMLLEPHRTPRQLRGEEGTDWPMSADRPVGPAILVNKVGKGMVVTIAGSPGFATASEHAILEARWLFRNAVRYLHPDPVVSISAPANVESVVTEDTDARRVRIHLIAYNPTPQTTPAINRPHVLPGLIEDVPLYRVAATIKRPLNNARALGGSTRVTRRGQHIEALVEDIHEVLIIDY